MRNKGLTTSELARRVGVTPPAIRKILRGTAYNSRFLHLIAHELGTTSAYRTGQTDDQFANAPPEPILSRDEKTLIEAFEQLSPGDRQALLKVAQTMADRTSPPPPGTTLHATGVKFTHREHAPA